MKTKKRKPAWSYVTRDGKHHRSRPKNGKPYRVVVRNLARYEAACRSGRLYRGLGGEVTDIRKATQ